MVDFVLPIQFNEYVVLFRMVHGVTYIQELCFSCRIFAASIVSALVLDCCARVESRGGTMEVPLPPLLFLSRIAVGSLAQGGKKGVCTKSHTFPF